jgi:hypothetical protein
MAKRKYKALSVEAGFIVSNGHRESLGDGWSRHKIWTLIQQALGITIPEYVVIKADKLGILPVPYSGLNGARGWCPVARQQILEDLDDDNSALYKFIMNHIADRAESRCSRFFCDLRLGE